MEELLGLKAPSVLLGNYRLLLAGLQQSMILDGNSKKKTYFQSRESSVGFQRDIVREGEAVFH